LGLIRLPGENSVRAIPLVSASENPAALCSAPQLTPEPDKYITSRIV